MRAIVCDKCGKVVLLEDELIFPEGINRLEMVSKGERIDLCDECTEELLTYVRRENDNERKAD